MADIRKLYITRLFGLSMWVRYHQNLRHYMLSSVKIFKTKYIVRSCAFANLYYNIMKLIKFKKNLLHMDIEFLNLLDVMNLNACVNHHHINEKLFKKKTDFQPIPAKN